MNWPLLTRLLNPTLVHILGNMQNLQNVQDLQNMQNIQWLQGASWPGGTGYHPNQHLHGRAGCLLQHRQQQLCPRSRPWQPGQHYVAAWRQLLLLQWGVRARPALVSWIWSKSFWMNKFFEWIIRFCFWIEYWIEWFYIVIQCLNE